MAQIKTKFIENSAVTGAKIASNAVDETKLSTSVAGNGLSGGGGTALSVNVDNSTVEINTDTVRVKDAGITTAGQVQYTSTSTGNTATIKFRAITTSV